MSYLWKTRKAAMCHWQAEIAVSYQRHYRSPTEFSAAGSQAHRLKPDVEKEPGQGGYGGMRQEQDLLAAMRNGNVHMQSFRQYIQM